MVRLAALVVLVLALPARGQQEGPAPVRDARATTLVTLDGEHPWSFERDGTNAWSMRAEALRRQILVAAGLWPLGERPEVSSVSTGQVDRGEYVVRNLALETLPGLWLTANLYVPARLEGRAPAVLSPHGHWADGRLLWRSDEEVQAELASGGEREEAAARSPLQARCAQLARLGCVVLHYDMVGYGEPWPLGHDDSFTDLESIEAGAA